MILSAVLGLFDIHDHRILHGVNHVYQFPPVKYNIMKHPMVKLLVLVAGVILSIAAAAVTVVPPPPEIDAASYLIMDSDSGYHLVEKNIDQRVEPASLTKMMTAYVVASQIAGGHIAMTDESGRQREGMAHGRLAYVH